MRCHRRFNENLGISLGHVTLTYNNGIINFHKQYTLLKIFLSYVSQPLRNELKRFFAAYLS